MRRIIALIIVVMSTSACTATQVQQWLGLDADTQQTLTLHVIDSAADEFGVSAHTMRELARCESTFNPGAKNPESSARGLFQYLDTTWTSARVRLYERGIDPEPYGEADVWNPVAQARITANVIAEGGWWWECRRSR